MRVHRELLVDLLLERNLILLEIPESQKAVHRIESISENLSDGIAMGQSALWQRDAFSGYPYVLNPYSGMMPSRQSIM